MQVTLYAYACAEEGLTPQVLTIFNLSTGEELHTERGAKDFAQMENRVREAGRQIQAGVFPGRPGFHCRYCPYESICPEQEEFA